MKLIKCIRCGIKFEDKNYKPEYGDATRTWCDKCIDKIYRAAKKQDVNKLSDIVNYKEENKFLCMRCGLILLYSKETKPPFCPRCLVKATTNEKK